VISVAISGRSHRSRIDSFQTLRDGAETGVKGREQVAKPTSARAKRREVVEERPPDSLVNGVYSHALTALSHR
jgi:hypothetical protein